MKKCYLCKKSLRTKDLFDAHGECLELCNERLNDNRCTFCGKKDHGNSKDPCDCGDNYDYKNFPGPQ